MNDAVLTEQDLAQLLQVPGKTVESLLALTELPRFYVEGKTRFLRERVLAWCQAHEGRDLLPPIAPVLVEPPPPRVVRVAELPGAKPGEHPWVPADARDALASGAGDAGRNLDRLKLRDALLELNDALLPTLTRLSGGRLHPHYDEKSRTSPWRLDLGSDGRIDVISIAWGAGEHAPAQFVDRPHVEVELSKAELRVALDCHGRRFVPPLDDGLIGELLDSGIAVEMAEGKAEPTPMTFAKVYPMPDPAPTTASVARALEADLERLVPLWARLA